MPSGLTGRDKGAEPLPLKLESPPYEAVSVFGPTGLAVKLHEPEGGLEVQIVPLSSVIVTVPPGVPLPGPVTDTVNDTITCCPTAAGFGLAEMLVVVSALFTVTAAVPVPPPSEPGSIAVIVADPAACPLAANEAEVAPA